MISKPYSLLLKSSYLSIREEEEMLRDSQDDTGKITSSKLESLRKKGEEIFKRDSRLVKKVIMLATENNKHFFIANQLTSFYCPKDIEPSFTESIFNTKIDTLSSANSYDILMFIKLKIKIILLYGETTADPRTDPMTIFSSCAYVSKLLNGVSLVF